MISKKKLKKSLDHFNFLKNSKNLSELFSKNLPTKNKNWLLLPLDNLIDKKFFFKKIDINYWIKNENKLAFYLVKNNYIPEIIIGITIEDNYDINLSIIYGKNKKIEIAESLICLIKYFREIIFIKDFTFHKSINKENLKKILNNNIFKVKKNILTAGPSISLLEISNTNKAVRYGWNEKQSDYIKKFESCFAKYIGVKHALSTSSCTGAIQIALMALNLGSNDEVIVPDLTWVATAAAVREAGAKPIFADIELDSWTIDPDSIKKKITKRTKAIIVVHLYGQPARMDKIIRIAKKYKIKIIEDAAASIGAEWKGTKCGNFGSFSTFSFQGAKLLVTGEGGMLVTNDTVMYNKAYKIWNQGRNPHKQFWIDQRGVKFKMSNMQAAFGLSQILRVEEQIQMKRRIFSWYEKYLLNTKNIKLNKEIKNSKSIYWMVSILIDKKSKITRDKLMKFLMKNKIDTRPVFPSLSKFPIWHKNFKSPKNSIHISKYALNLPSGISLTEIDVAYICDKITKAFQ